MNRRRGEAILVGGQALMVVALAVCVGLHPGLVLKRNESGLSNYGVHLRTVIPYSIALLAAGGSCLCVAASDFPLPRRNRVILLVYGLCTCAVLLSTYPYLVNHVWHAIHVGCGILLMVWEFFTAWWLTVRSRWRQRWIWQLGQSAGSVLALVTLTGQLHVLFVAQVMTGSCWGVAMIGNVTAKRSDHQPVASAPLG